MHHGAVLCHDAVDEVQIAGHAPQRVEDPARHQHDDNAARACLGDSLEHRRVNAILPGDRAVIVQRDRRQLHDLAAVGACDGSG